MYEMWGGPRIPLESGRPEVLRERRIKGNNDKRELKKRQKIPFKDSIGV
jgi:hypothetical protein